MAKEIHIGRVYGLDKSASMVRPLETVVQTDETGYFTVQLGGATLDWDKAQQLARDLLTAGSKAKALNMAGSITR